MVVAVVVLLVLFLRQVPKTYPLAATPISPPTADALGAGLEGFDSPYLGHTGSWNGKGGGLGGGTKENAMDQERAMGLRWTFMPVYWRALEPDGPADLSGQVPPAWTALDAFVIQAQRRGLNILMQAPVVGGNAGGPPLWAGRREKGKSAPANMEALADFAGKLAERYRPGGTLARREGWGHRFGVRAWEMDNEPESYLTHWKGQAPAYAEFVILSAQRIKRADPQAVMVGPGMSAGKGGLAWLALALDPATNSLPSAAGPHGSFCSLGQALDAVSFHDYEGLDSAFSGGPRTIAQVFEDVRAVFEQHEHPATPASYSRKQEYWHTEGNFDFLGLLSAERRAAWRFQWFARAFAAGIRKVCVMDASSREQVAVRAFVTTLPNPFPMLLATNEVVVLRGQAMAFRHPDGPRPDAGQVWVLWALAGTGDALVEIPVLRPSAQMISVTGTTNSLVAQKGRVRIELKGDAKMAPSVLVVDRP